MNPSRSLIDTVLRLVTMVVLMVSSSQAYSAGPSDPVILVLLKTLDNPFFTEIERGFRSEWKDRQVAIQVRAGKDEGDYTGQRSVLEAFYLKYVKDKPTPLVRGVVLTPSGSGNEIVQYIKPYRDAGVPVILLDTGIEREALEREGTNYNMLFASDNTQGGELAAEILLSRLKEKIAGKCHVLLLEGVPDHDTAQRRRAGFLRKFEELTQGNRIPCGAPTEKTANWRRSEARNVLDALMTAGTHFDGIFAANDEMALGALEALRSLPPGTTPPIIVGFDGTEEAREAIKQGRLDATIAQDPGRMGQEAARELPGLWGDKQKTVQFVNKPIPVRPVP